MKVKRIKKNLNFSAHIMPLIVKLMNGRTDGLKKVMNLGWLLKSTGKASM